MQIVENKTVHTAAGKPHLAALSIAEFPHQHQQEECKEYIDFTNRKKLYNILKPENEDPPPKCTSD